MWDYMGLIRVYTKRRGCPPVFREPLVLSSERRGVTVEVACENISKGTFALVFPSFLLSLENVQFLSRRLTIFPVAPFLSIFRPTQNTNRALRHLQLCLGLGPQHQVRPATLRLATHFGRRGRRPSGGQDGHAAKARKGVLEEGPGALGCHQDQEEEGGVAVVGKGKEGEFGGNEGEGHGVK